MEVAQVGEQGACTERQAVHQTDIVLLVKLLQLAVVVTERQRLASFVVGTGKPEPLAVVACRTVGSNRMVATGIARAELIEITTGEAEAGYFGAGDLGAFEGLRQQT
ncbi:hypothetical protein D9M68_978590 [compost metagenome]